MGVWIDKDTPIEEDYAYYETIYDNNVDMVTTDYPVEANRMLSEIHQKRQQSKATISSD